MYINTNGKDTIDNVRVSNKPKIKKSIERIPQIIQRASLTVISHKKPSKLSSKIKPNGALKERQKNPKNSVIKVSHLTNEVRVNEPIVANIANPKTLELGEAK